MINIGDTYLIFKFETSLKKENFENKENDIENNNIKDLLINDIINIHVAELNHNKETQSRNFQFDSNKKIIRIGRKKNNNDIELKDSLVSKINCNIQYNGINGWFINDGDETITHIGESKKNKVQMELGFLQLMILEFMKTWYLNVILIFLNVILLNKIITNFFIWIFYI